jgi:hypothetical protein
MQEFDRSRWASTEAPTARDITARGKRKAKRSASPLGERIKSRVALKGRNIRDGISAFQALTLSGYRNQGRRASRLPLAFIFRAVGALFDF